MIPEKDIEKLSELYLHGGISDAELVLLNRVLQDDSQARTRFLELTKLECALHDHFRGNAPILLESPAAHSRADHRQGGWSRSRFAWPLAAAACALLGFLIGHWKAKPDDRGFYKSASAVSANQTAGHRAQPSHPAPGHHEGGQLMDSAVGPLAGSGDFDKVSADKSGWSRVWLDDLGVAHFKQEVGTPQVNRSVTEGDLVVAGVKYSRGIGTHAESGAVYEIPSGTLDFTAMGGISDDVLGQEWHGKKAGCLFKVIGDNVVLWESGLMRAGDKAKQVKVSLQGIHEMRLVVEDGPDGNAFDHANWMDARFTCMADAPEARAWTEDRSSFILTPTPGPAPRINGATVVGGTPGKPFLFRIPTTGTRPIEFRAKGLPEGIVLDRETGILRGTVPAEGTYKVTVHAHNQDGEDERELRIVSGDTLALTPPMGWNSWYCWSESISAEKVRNAAQALVSQGLADHGWTYVNIDDCWQGERGGPLNAIQGNARFEDIKGLCEAVHREGLKVGIYSTPWIGSYAGFVGGSSMSANGRSPELHVAPEDRSQPAQVYGRYPNFHNLNLDRVGEYWLCDEDAKQWSDWGIDFVKYDWKPNDVPTSRRLEEGLRRSGRDMILSLSNDTPFGNAVGISKMANLWRTGGDIHDDWASILRNGFDKTQWIPFAGPGHWNDPDMLQVGMAGVPNNYVRTLKPSRLTPDEQYSHVSLWSLLSAPLLISCDVESMDAFTLNLLTNDEVIAVNQDALGKSAAPVGGNKEIWLKELEDGSYALGVFNLEGGKRRIEVTWDQLGLPAGLWQVRDLWRQKELGEERSGFSTEVESHGVTLVSLRKMP